MSNLRVALDALGSRACVATAAGRSVSGAELELRARALARAIEAAPDSRARALVLAFGHDALACAAALLAARRLGRRATLALHARRELLAALASEAHRVLFVHDTRFRIGIDATRLADAPDATGSQAVDAARASGFELSTVGEYSWSYGPPAVLRGGLVEQELGPQTVEDELRRWSDELLGGVDGPVMCTLAPASLPGVLLGILAPLSLGIAFVGCERGARAWAQATEAARAAVVVGAPAHLRALLAAFAGPVAALQRVVAVGGELDDQLAHAWRQRHGIDVVRGPGARGAADESRAACAAARRALGAAAATGDIAVVETQSGRFALAESPIAPCVALREPGAVHLRWVRELPRDPNGVVACTEVLRHFERDREARPLRLDFEWRGGREAQRVTVPADSAWFDGHFPGYPVLAGAVQMQELVLPVLRERAGRAVRVVAWHGLKFLARIESGQSLTVHVAVDSANRGFTFEIARGAERCTVGGGRYELAGSDGARARERGA